MKNILYVFVASLILLSGCNKDEEPLFDKSPEERLNAVLADYKSKLVEGDGYWIAYYYGNAILMKFNADNTVVFKSTFSNRANDRIVTYRVGASQVPELVFESHTVFHSLYEKNRSTAEYEFLFDKLSSEKIELISKTDLGAKKTKLSFYKSTVDGVEKVELLKKKVEVLSVFKSVIDSKSSDYTGSLTLNANGTATLVSKKGEIVKKQESKFTITLKGILFSPELSVGNDLLVAEFTYDEATNSFQSVEEESVTIEMKAEPVLPLTSYDFAKRPSAAYNTFDRNKSSVAFLNFLNGYAQLVNSDIRIDKIFFRNLNVQGAVPYIYISTNKGAVQYYISYEIKADGKLYIKLTGDTTGGALVPLLKPLIDLFANTKGHYIEGTGKLVRYRVYVHKTFSLINADNPAYAINFYEFG